MVAVAKVNLEKSHLEVEPSRRLRTTKPSYQLKIYKENEGGILTQSCTRIANSLLPLEARLKSFITLLSK